MAPNSYSKLLTIIIPTWNRCPLLKRNLKALLSYVSGYKDQLYIYVSDNASDDGTQEYIQELIPHFDDILIYHRQSQNIGALANFMDAVKNANSEYVHLLGDDDMLTPFFLPTMFSLISKYPEVFMFHLNAISVNHAAKRISGLRNPMFYEGSVQIYSDFSTFAKEHLAVPSLMSTNVFKRKCFLDTIVNETPDDYPGYFWLYQLYRSCISRQIAYFPYPLIVQFVPEKQRWNVDLPWYYIYGCGHLFKELDTYCPGVYMNWQNHLYQNSNGMEQMLHTISKNRDLYKKRYDKMVRYLNNAKYRKLLRLCVYSPSWLVTLRTASMKVNEYLGYIRRKI